MLRTVYKFNLHMILSHLQIIMLPVGYKIVRVAWQYGQPRLWAEIDPAAAPVPVELMILGTGREIPPNAVHVGSFKSVAEEIYHVYQLVPA